MFKKLVVLTLMLVSLTALAYPAAAKTVLYFTGKASKTTAIDVSGKNNDGKLNNVSVTKGGLYSFGKLGRTSYISVPVSRSINPDRENYAYSVKVRFPDGYEFSHDVSLVRRGAAKLTGPYYKMELVWNKDSGNTSLVCAMRDKGGTTGYVSRSAAGIDDGEWHSLSCRKTSNTVSVTRDGSTNSQNVRVGNLSSDRNLYFGVENNTIKGQFTERFKGQMDDIKITKG